MVIQPPTSLLVARALFCFIMQSLGIFFGFWFPCGITSSWLSCVHLLYAGAFRGQDPLMLSDLFLEVCLAESCCFPPIY